MFRYVWPIGLVVFSNVMYQLCTKSVPEDVNPFASLIVTYLIGALFSAVMYLILKKDGNLLSEFGRLNWAPFVLGLVIVGLEVGFIFAYKAGWPVSTASTVQGTILAVVLIFVGWGLYREELTRNKVLGILFCLVGLFFINRK